MTPLNVASSATNEPAAQESVSGGVARMNRASRKLEISRAALGPSVHIDGDASDAMDEPESAREGGAGNSTGSQSSTEALGETKVARAPVSAASIMPDDARVPAAADEAADASGIPPASRRMLIVVGAVVAVSIIVFRLARRSVS